jgi:hypothetical protein
VQSLHVKMLKDRFNHQSLLLRLTGCIITGYWFYIGRVTFSEIAVANYGFAIATTSAKPKWQLMSLVIG